MSKQRAHFSDQTKPLIKLLQKLAYRHPVWEVFQDFLLMSANAISNAVDPLHFEEREKEYMETVKKYTPEELQVFPEAFAQLVAIMDECAEDGKLEDILGRLFHDLELHNKYKGQFFTPMPVARLMAGITIGENDPDVERDGFVTVGEPACGSGVMVIAFAQAMKEAGYNYCQQVLAVCTDIDINCVRICYIQLSLYGIPAIVRHGNALSMEEWSRWFAPVYMVGGWSFRNRRRGGESDVKGADPAPQEYDYNLREGDDGQFSLF